MTNYFIRDISLPYTAPQSEAENAARARLQSAGARVTDARIFRRSVDARKKNDVCFVYTVLCSTEGGSPKKLAAVGAVREQTASDVIDFGTEPLSAPPVICGFGPAGIFAALTLAENGYAPVVCERGSSPAVRTEKIERFFKTGMLDPETNVQFGAGGAGMFSDGKLMTRINDPLCRMVLEKMRDLGAPDDILVNARPHVGTDLLCSVVEKAAGRIVGLGGTIYYDTAVTGIVTDSAGAVTSVKTSRGDLPCGALVLAVGHSARDTYGMLRGSGYDLTPKPISVGFRIEHLRDDVDRALYGDHAGDPLLGAAEYNLSARVGGCGIYTFCMCPGGEVVAAASEEGGVVTNGASAYARDGINSNAAVAISISTPDPLGLQIQLERAAFKAGGGEFAAPVQTAGDFIAGRHGTDPSRVLPTYTRGVTRTADVAALLPAGTAEKFAAGLRAFGRRIAGFDVPDAVITGLETRTTAPFRMARGVDMTAPGHGNLYPCGEGAGWAGGITSAAVDGIKAARELMKRYRSTKKD